MVAGGCEHGRGLDRRSFLAALAAGALGALAGCRTYRPEAGIAAPITLPRRPSTTTSSTVPPTGLLLGPVPRPRPGIAEVVSKAPTRADTIALTIDDGFCEECVDAYVDFAASTGIHITFSPNGRYRRFWDVHAPRLRPLISAGQVQIGNHTWSHKRLTGLSDQQVEDEIERNEEWIQEVFGITARPWFRPPFGVHDERVDTLCGDLGYTKIFMWNGTLGDAAPLTADQLLHQADLWFRPGTIVLGHANHPTVIELFDQLRALLEERQLVPITLDDMFGTSRTTG
ncbi:MAG TPA: polysaccharide deacetylase family protein [Acidimicrobiales bacterium]|nr:polysaccharide deacetylase family protein [Acidimicrobiales bacterium]